MLNSWSTSAAATSVHQRLPSHYKWLMHACHLLSCHQFATSVSCVALHAGLLLLWVHSAAHGARHLHCSRAAVPCNQSRPAAAAASIQQRLPEPLQLAHHCMLNAVPGSVLSWHGPSALGCQCRDLSGPGQPCALPTVILMPMLSTTPNTKQ